MKKIVWVVVPIVVILIVLIGLVVFKGKPVKDDKDIVSEFVANQDKEYTDEEKIQIVTAYKNMLENEGEEYVDMLFSQEEQTAVTYLGMSVNIYVFRDFKKRAYFNADNSFMDVADYSKIAGFDVDAAPGADGFADIANVDIVIDDTKYTTANLTDEISSFFERLNKAKETEDVNTICGVDIVDVDANTRLYITYMDVEYDDSYNVKSLRVSGHLVMK